MKYCNTCHTTKPFEKFNRKRNGYNYQCKDCKNTHSRQYYKSNKAAQYRRVVKNKRARVAENRIKLYDYLITHPCVDCGETDPLVLEFDHQRDKRKEVTKLIYDGYSWETIQDEIAKCLVRRANCHKRKTAKEFGWWMVTYIDETCVRSAGDDASGC